MTFRSLAEKISQMTEEQKDCHVAIYDSVYEEVYSGADDGVELKFVKAGDIVSDLSDVLDENHPYIIF